MTKNTAQQNDQLLSISEAAAKLGVSIDTVRRWDEKGIIRSVRTPGGTRKFYLSTLKAAKQNRREFTKPLSIGEAAALLGSSVSSLRRWDSEGVLVPNFRTPNGDRQYTTTQLQEYLAHGSPLTADSQKNVIARRNDEAIPASPARFAGSSRRADSPEIAAVSASRRIIPRNDEPSPPASGSNNSNSALYSIRHTLYSKSSFTLLILTFLIAVITAGAVRDLITKNASNNQLTTSKIVNLAKSVENQQQALFALQESGTPVAEAKSLNSTNTLKSLNSLSSPKYNVGGPQFAEVLGEIFRDTTLEVNTNLAVGGLLAAPQARFTAATNQLILGNNLTISAEAQAAPVVATIPALTADSTFLFTDQSQTITNKIISGSANTITSLPNSALANPSITVNTSGTLSGGGVVALGGTITLTGTSTSATGVTSLAAGTGITVSGSTGGVTVTNSGVTALTGTANQVIASAASGSVTLTLPQSIATTSTVQFGNIGVGTATPDASAVVDLTSTTKGFLTPRMTTTERNAISSPAEGLLIFNTTTGQFNVYTGGVWTTISGSSSSSWSSLTDPSANLSLAMTGYTSTFTYNAATGASNLFNLTDTTSNTGTGYLFNLTTATGSTLKPFHVSAAGTEAITVLATGNVGIGTTNPSQMLAVGSSGQLTVTSAGNLATTATLAQTYSSGTNSTTGATFNTTNSAASGTVGVSALGINLNGTASSGANTITGINFGNASTAANNTINGISFGSGFNNFITSGTVNLTSAGVISGLTGVTSSGTITFSSLGTGIAHFNSSGVISSSAVNLAGADITGTLAIGNGGTGVASTPTSGQLLIGNASSGYTLAGLSSGTGITVTPGSGSITVTNSGVTSIVAGTDITISGATGAVTVNDASTLATVTGRGASTATAITLSNTSPLTLSGASPTITANNGDLTLDLSKAATNTLVLVNSNVSADVADLNLSDGSLKTAGTTRLSNAGALSSITTINASGAVTISNYATDKGLLYTNGTGGLIAQTAQGAANTVLHGNGTSAPTFSAVSLTADVSGTLPVGSGGTNATATPTAGAVAYGTGSAYAFTLAGSSGECLKSGATGSPTWGACSTGSVTGTGSTNTLAKFTGASTVGDSSITDDGTTITLTGNVVLPAGKNLTLQSGAGAISQTYTGTSTNAFSTTANSLTSASALSVTSSNNSAANTAWSSTLLSPTNAQGTTAVSTGSIIGLDVQFNQNTSIAGNTETVGRLNVKQNDSSSTDATINSILDLANNDTATGNQITVTDGLKISGANVTNGINLSGTFGTNLITSTNFTLTQGGAITAAGTPTFSTFSTNGGLLYTNASGVVTQTGAGTSTTVLHGGTTPSYSAVSLTADVTGTLPVANGGTGVASTTAYGVLLGGTTSTGAFQNAGAGSADQVLISGGASAVSTWSNIAGLLTAGTDITFSGTTNVTINDASTLSSVTGRGATTTTLVNLDGGIAVDTSNFTVSGTSGAIVSASTITANTTGSLNGLNVNSGALSAITGYAQSSGNFAQSGTGTFGTGTGAVSLNGDTTLSANKNLSLASGTGTFTQTYVSPTDTNTAATFAVTNSAAAGTVAVKGVGINLAGTTTTGANTITGLNFGAVTTVANNTFNGITFSTGYNNFLTSGTINITAAGAVTGATGVASSGTIAFTGLSSGSGSTLCLNVSNQVITCTVGAGGVSGSGTQNYLTKWNNAAGTSIGDTVIYDDGTNVGIGTTVPGAKLAVGATSQFQVSSIGVITAPTSSNTINGLIISSGALSGITGYTQTSGAFAATLTTTNSATFSSSTAGSDPIALKPQSAVTTNAFTGTITSADLTSAKTWSFPDVTGSICLVEAGNCAGSGTGVTTSGGSTNKIPKFTAAQAVNDSSITDVAGTLSFDKEVAKTIQITDSTTADTAGALLTLKGAAGIGTGAGGALAFTAGASGTGATGNGGAITLTPGAALSTNGTGGNLTLITGAGKGTGLSGAASLSTGAADSGTATGTTTVSTGNATAAASGLLTLSTGTTTTSGTTGAISITTGNSAGASGALTLDVGTNSGTAGTISLGATNGRTITIGSSSATGVSITDDNWSVTTGGAANFVSVGATTAGSGAFTTLTSSGNSTIGTGASGTHSFGTGAGSSNTIGNSTGTLTLASGGTSAWTNTSGNLSIATATSGTLALTSAGALNETNAAASTYSSVANTAASYKITDGTNAYFTLDTRTGASGVSSLTFATGTAPTIASGASTYFNSATFTPGTVNFLGSTQITSTGTSANNALLFNQPTINRTDAATSLVIDQASNLFINGATIASHATVGQTETITASSALRIGAGASVAGTRGVVTNAYSLYVDAPTGGGANYAAYFASNVGIGTTTPGKILDVVGEGRFSSTLTASSGFTVAAGTSSLTGTVNINTAGTGTTSIGNSSGGALALASGAASTFTVTGADLTLSTATSGTLALTSAGALNLTAAAASTWDIGNNTLSIQTANGGAISLGGNVTISGAKTFTTGTGAVGLNGDITIASGKSLTYAGGASNFDQSASSGTFATGTGSVSLNGATTVAAGKNLSLASGAGTFSQAFIGTSTTATSITATSLTTGKALNLTSSNNSAADTAWSASQFNITNAQGTTAVSTGSIIGLDLEFTQNTSVAGNTETAAAFNIKQNDSSTTDSTVASILNLANNDTVTGNQITVTDGLKIVGTNITNGINLSGTFGTNLITSTNFTLTQGGALTAAGTPTFSTFSTNGGLLYTNGSGVVSQTGAGTSTTVLHGGTTPSYSAVSLTADVSGTLPIANGGTNATATPTAGAVAYGTGSAYAFTLAGSSGQCLTSAGAGTPTWVACSTGSVTGSGSTNQLSKFTSASVIGDSSINDTAGTFSFTKEVAKAIQIADSTTTDTAGAALTIKGAAGAATNAAGGALNLTGGAGAGSGNGGALVYTGGAAGATGTGGGISLTTGAGGSGSGASGVLSLTTGATTSGNSGAITIDPGVGTGGTNGTISIGTANASAISLGRTGVTTTNTGALTSTQTLTASNGFTLTTGSLTATSTGGNFNLSGSSGTFLTSTGANTLSGDTTVTAGKNFSLASGAGTFTQTYSTGSDTNIGAIFNTTNSASSGTIGVSALGINLTGTDNATGANTVTGINFGNVTAHTNNTYNGLTFGTGLTNFITSGTVNLTAAGVFTGLTGLTSSGTITFSGLSSAGIVHNNSSGVLSTSAINLAGGSSEVTGTLPVANGGTGVASTTAYGVLLGGTTSTGAFQNAGAGTSGQVLTSGGASAVSTWTDQGALTPRWNSIIAPTGNQSLAMAAYTTTWNWATATTGNQLSATANLLSTGTLFDLSSTSTAGDASKLLNLSRSGTNGTAGKTNYGLYSAITNDGATSTNVAGYFSATGATTANYGLIVAAGNVGIGTTTPSAGALHVVGQCVTGDTLLKRRRRKKKRHSGEAESLDRISKDQQDPIALPGTGQYLALLQDDTDWIWEDIRIDQIQEGDEILTLDETTGEFIPQRVNALMDMGIHDIYQLITESGKKIKTTGNHPYFVKDKNITTLSGGVYDVDQSPKLEQLSKDSFIAIANSQDKFVIKVSKAVKKEVYRLYKTEGRVMLFGPNLLAYAIAALVKKSNITPNRLEIDLEYSGYERQIIQLLSFLTPGVSITFKAVGKSSPAHFASYGAYKGKGKITAQASLNDLYSTKKDRSTLGVGQGVLAHLDKSQAIRNTCDLMRQSYQKITDLSTAGWKKVYEIKPGMLVATVDGWERIVSLKKLSREQVYDIEVEGTHNFVGNSIVAHNTYINSTATTASIKGLEVVQSGAISGTGYAGYFSKTGASTTNVGLYATATGATNNYAAIFEAGNVGIGTTAPGANLDVYGSSTTLKNTYSNGTFTIGADNGTSAVTSIVGSSYVAFSTYNSGWNEKVRITSGGNVGIGTTAPSTKLHVANQSTDTTLTIEGLSGGALQGVADINFNDNSITTGKTGLLIGTVRNSTSAQLSDLRILGKSNDTDTTMAKQLLYINGSSGNVGIGTTAPGAMLQLGTAGTSTGTIGLTGATSGMITVTPAAAAGTWTMTLPTGAGTANYVLQTDGAGVTSWVNPINSVGWALTGNSGTTAGTNFLGTIDAVDLVFKTNATEYMRLTSGGNLGIGTSTPTSSIVGGARTLDISSSGNTELTLHSTTSAQESSIATTGTGLYLDVAGHATATNNFIQFRTVNTNSNFSTLINAMRIDSAGNVGIGTTAPAVPLQVVGGGRITGTDNGKLAINGTSAAYTYVGHAHNDLILGSTQNGGGYGIAQISMGYTGDNNRQIQFGTASDSTFNGSTTFLPRMTVTSTGNVGIGTVTPLTKVHAMHGGVGIIQQSSGVPNTTIGLRGYYPTLAFNWLNDGATGDLYGSSTSSYAGQLSLEPSSGDIYFQTTNAGTYPNAITAATTRFIIKQNGNVGIGTTTPAYNLAVVGTLNVTGAVSCGSGCGAGSSQWTTTGSNIYYSAGNVGIGTNSPDALLALGSTAHGYIRFKGPTIAEGNIYHDATYGIHMDTSSNNLPIKIDGSQLFVGNNSIALGTTTIPAGTTGQTLLAIGPDTNLMAENSGGASNSINISQNGAYNTGTWQYIESAKASNYYQNLGTHVFRVSNATGTAGNTITWISPLTIDNTGNVILAASNYLNWGATGGTSGYGIRDNAGTMEFKNSAGSWASFATAAGSAGGWTDLGTTVALTTGTDNVGIGTTSPNITGYGSTSVVTTIQGTGGSGGVLELASSQASANNISIGDLSWNLTTATAGHTQLAAIQARTRPTGGTAGKLGGQIAFYTKLDNGAVTERMRLDDTGNVGIGTTAPSSLLQVTTSTTGIVDVLTLKTLAGGGTATVGDGTGILFSYTNPGHDMGHIRSSWVTTSLSKMEFGTIAAADYAIPMTLYGANVGIGTTTPGAKLSIAGDIIQTASAYHNWGATAGTTGYGFRDNAGTMEFKNSAGSWAAITSGAATGGWTDGGTTVALTTGTDNVGIGTATAATSLHIYKTSAAAETIPLTLQNADNTAATAVSIGFSAHTVSNLITGKIANIIGGGNNYQMAFYTHGTGLAERMRIDQNGNVGIGTTAPANQVDATTPLLQLYGIAQRSTFELTNSSTGTTGTAGSFAFTNGTQRLGQIDVAADGATNSGYMNFFTWNAGSPTTAMTIKSTGNVGIGTTAPGTKLDVQFGTAGSTAETRAIYHTDNTNAASHAQLDIQTGGASGGDPKLILNIDGATLWNVGVDNSDSDKFMIGTNAAVGTGTLFTMQTNGNVGIGTTTPGGKLAIISTDTTTNSYSMTANSLTTGIGNYTSSTSTGLTTGGLMSLDWSPASSVTAYTGDLFSLNGGQYANSGNLFNIKDNGSSIFQVNKQQITAAIPTQFTAAGDVSIAYDINLTNPTASYIKSAAPMYLTSGETFNSSDLNLTTYNYGNIILNTASTGKTLIPLGNVGIGTTGPTSLLHVSTANAEGAIKITSTTGTNAAWQTFVNTGGNYFFGVDNSSGNRLFATGGAAYGFSMVTESANPILFGTTNIERMRITSGGNVGIGTTTPPSPLAVMGAIYSNAAETNTVFSGTVANNAAYIGPSGYWALRSDTSHNLNIDVYNSASPKAGLQLQQDGDVVIAGSGTTCTIGTGTGATNCTSDARLKENVVTLGSNLEKILQLRPVNFTWIDPTKDQSQKIGLIAQEVEQIFPEFIADVNGYKGLDYAALITPAIKAIQELATTTGAAYKLNAQGVLEIPELRVGKLTLDPSLKLDGSAEAEGTLSFRVMSLEDRVRDLENGLASSNSPVPSFSDTLNALATAQANTESVIASQSEAISGIATDSANLRNDVTNVAFKTDNLQASIASTSNTLTQLQALINSFVGDATNSSQLASNNNGNDLNLTPPSVLVATDSATLANINVTEKATTLKLDATDVSIAGLFTTMGDNFFGGSTFQGGDFVQSGTFSITGGNTINAIGLASSCHSRVGGNPAPGSPVGAGDDSCGTLHIQNSPLAGAVDFFNGLVTITKDGLLKANTVLAAEIKVEPNKTTGNGVVPAGSKTVEIVNPLVKRSSRILITPTTETSKVLAVTAKVEETTPGSGHFVVSAPSINATDIYFDWWILNEEASN